MQDITFNLDGYVLNSRCAALIIHDGKVLLHKNPAKSHYATIGGRIRLGEDSETAVKREFFEETGKEIEIKSFLGIVENFFNMNDKKYHEYLFLYEAEFKDENDKKITCTMYPAEEHKKGILQFEWIDISNLENIDVRPNIVKKLLINNDHTTHLINIQK